ncbi:gamma-glutamyltransferase, partial [Streptomyces sp. MS2A]|nr:gamma-glutamyltransferase [Streptomyces sp. MS2A]
LMALRLMEGFDASVRDDPQLLHRQFEAMKLAYTDGHHHITQSDHMRVSVESLLSDDYAATRRRLIRETASDPEPGQPQAGGTVYLATADEAGNM